LKRNFEQLKKLSRTKQLAIVERVLQNVSEVFFKSVLKVFKLTNFMGYGIGTTFLHTDLRDKFTVWVY
jgi:hypothetical protein